MLPIDAVTQMLVGFYQRRFGDPRIAREFGVTVTAKSLSKISGR